MHQPTDPRRRPVRAVARPADMAASALILGAVGIIAVLILTSGAIVTAGLH